MAAALSSTESQSQDAGLLHILDPPLASATVTGLVPREHLQLSAPQLIAALRAWTDHLARRRRVQHPIHTLGGERDLLGDGVGVVVGEEVGFVEHDAFEECWDGHASVWV